MAAIEIIVCNKIQCGKVESKGLWPIYLFFYPISISAFLSSYVLCYYICLFSLSYKTHVHVTADEN